MEKLNMEQYLYDPNDEHWGFKSWNDFFTRKFNNDYPKVEYSEADFLKYTNTIRQRNFAVR